jgi:hypothetical protein
MTTDGTDPQPVGSDQSTPANRFAWERMILRLRLGRTTKLVALALATYGNANGANAHPGVDRLAADLESDERTVRRSLDRLRRLGLIERTHSGSSSGRRKLSDCYRLTVPPDPLALVEMLASPATEHRALVPSVPVADHRAAAPGDGDFPASDHRALVPSVPVADHRAAAPGDGDFPASDQRALVTRSPGTGDRSPGSGAHLPRTSTKDDHENKGSVAELLTACASDDTTLALLARVDEMTADGASPEEIGAFLAETRAAS